MSLQDHLPVVLSSARHTLQQMTDDNIGMNPMLHVDFGDTVTLAMLDTAPRKFDDPYEIGQGLRDQYGRTPVAVFFISDAYQFVGKDETAEDDEAFQRYMDGTPLEALFMEGVSGVSEALHIVGMDDHGKVALAVQPYLRGVPIIWDAPQYLPGDTQNAGAVHDLLRGLLGLVRDVRLPGL